MMLLGAPDFAGRTMKVSSSPCLNVSFLQPSSDIIDSGEATSPVHCTALPLASAVLQTISTWGFFQMYSTTVPFMVISFGENVDAPWCARTGAFNIADTPTATIIAATNIRPNIIRLLFSEVIKFLSNVGPTGRPTVGTVSLMGIGRSPHIASLSLICLSTQG